MTSKETLAKIIKTLEKRGITVRFADTGTDDLEIGELRDGVMLLNRHSRDELDMIFTIAHLFGHYCQFKNYNKYRHLVEAVAAPVPIELSDSFRDEFLAYEREAFGIGKTLIQEVRPPDDDWTTKYKCFMTADFEHFWTYITTGKKEAPTVFNQQLRTLYRQEGNNEHTNKHTAEHAGEDGIDALPIPEYSTTDLPHPEVIIF